jgi:hypothetical protein
VLREFGADMQEDLEDMGISEIKCPMCSKILTLGDMGSHLRSTHNPMEVAASLIEIIEASERGEISKFTREKLHVPDTEYLDNYHHYAQP